MRPVLAIAIGSLALALTEPRADVVRTVYFSAVDGKGAPVDDLTAAELTVKEGGKDRQIAAVQRATGPIQVSLLVDDAGSGVFQRAVAGLLQQMLGHAQFAISVMSPQPIKVANFAADVAELRSALDRMGPRGKVEVDGEQIIEAVAEAAKELQQRKAVRPSIVVLTAIGEKSSSGQAESVLNVLKSSGASLSVLYVAGLDLGTVLADGPKQSGGISQQVSVNAAAGPVLARIADNLLHQYILTYNIPDGVKLNEKLSLSTSRKGVTLVAPSRLPDK